MLVVDPPRSQTRSDASSNLSVQSAPSVSSKSSSQSFRSPSPKFFDRVKEFAAEQAESPIARWLKKHRNEPVAAGKRWVVERLQFSGAMFDPSGLKERYIHLVNWQNGMWVNYWTQTLPNPIGDKHEIEERQKEQVAYNNMGLMETGIVASSMESGESSSSSIEREWMREIGKAEQEGNSENTERKMKGGRHFIILPTGLGRKFGGEGNWEKVIIGGVDDEVAAHCGLFIRGQNLDYDGLVGKVGNRILQWCQRLQ